MRVTATCITGRSPRTSAPMCPRRPHTCSTMAAARRRPPRPAAPAWPQRVLVDAAPTVRASLTMRYAGHPKIAVIAAEQAAALPKASFDLIVMHSVAQYLTTAELDRLLGIFRTLLKPDGLFILGDVVPPHFPAPAAAPAPL